MRPPIVSKHLIGQADDTMPFNVTHLEIREREKHTSHKNNTDVLTVICASCVFALYNEPAPQLERKTKTCPLSSSSHSGADVFWPQLLLQSVLHRLVLLSCVGELSTQSSTSEAQKTEKNTRKKILLIRKRLILFYVTF